MRDSKKVYLGDGAYACFERGMLKVWTSNGIVETNVVFFEPEVWSALVKFVADTVSTGEADREE